MPVHFLVPRQGAPDTQRQQNGLYFCSEYLLEQMPMTLLLIFIAVAHQGHVRAIVESW